MDSIEQRWHRNE